MKELSMEEKAKAYDKALEKARQLCAYPTSKPFISDLQDLFPELKESEDEKIRDSLLEYLHTLPNHYAHSGVCAPEWIAWLENNMGISEATKQKLEDNLNEALEKETQESWNEFLNEKKPYGQREECSNCQMNYAGLCKGSCAMKRGEQKPAEEYNITGIDSKNAQGKLGEMLKNLTDKVKQKSAWSEEDETTKNNISHIIRQYDKISKSENKPCYYVGDCLLWMQNIKDRVQPQSKQEWSEENETYLDHIINAIKSCYTDDKGKENPWREELLRWLNSLKERYTWKPSNEQIMVLAKASETYCGKDKGVLYSLYNDLKKLMEE